MAINLREVSTELPSYYTATSGFIANLQLSLVKPPYLPGHAVNCRWTMTLVARDSATHTDTILSIQWERVFELCNMSFIFPTAISWPFSTGQYIWPSNYIEEITTKEDNVTGQSYELNANITTVQIPNTNTRFWEVVSDVTYFIK